MKITVLVATTTRWFPTARLAMGLARAGFAVEAVCPPGHPISKTSVGSSCHPYNGIRPVASFARAIAAAKPDLIVSGDDLATRQLHELHKRELGRGVAGADVCALIERSLGARESFPVVFARSEFMAQAQQQGIRGPVTDVIADLNDLKKWVTSNGFPFVLKADGTSGGDGVKIVHTLAEAEAAYQQLAAPPLLARAAKRTIFDRDSTLLRSSLLRERGIVNAQAFAPGCEATSAIACWRGEILASLHFQVIKKAKAAGHATVVRAIQNREMEAAAEQMVRRLCLSGLHGLDFMLEESGQAHLIEINPRSTQIGHLALGPGRDLPAALYAAVSSKAIQPAPKVTENDTFALFPQEWMRNANSPFLRSAYHDVPWQEPGLVQACVLSRSRQSGWYSADNQANEAEREGGEQIE